jgi:RNA polymerase sigma-70 factor (ECF subfamily)
MHREELLQRVYEQLRAQAQNAMRSERRDHTLTATALVHEAYLRLGNTFGNEGHFYASAAESMRRVLIDHARAKLAQKRGGGGPAEGAGAARRVELPEVADLGSLEDPEEILALDGALLRLKEEDAQAAAVVSMRFFAGLDVAKTAAALGISERTVKRDWQFARAFLYRCLAE